MSDATRGSKKKAKKSEQEREEYQFLEATYVVLVVHKCSGYYALRIDEIIISEHRTYKDAEKARERLMREWLQDIHPDFKAKSLVMIDKRRERKHAGKLDGIIRGKSSGKIARQRKKRTKTGKK